MHDACEELGHVLLVDDFLDAYGLLVVEDLLAHKELLQVDEALRLSEGVTG